MDSRNAPPDHSPISPEKLVALYRDLQRYVEWTPQDEQNLVSCRPLIEPHFVELVDDFYRQLEKHEPARRVITGGETQVERLKLTLIDWLHEIFRGDYDEDFICRRWRVGWRHVQIGLDQAYYNTALARLRFGITESLSDAWEGTAKELGAMLISINRLLDLDLAIIDHAYYTEFIDRHERAQRLANIGQIAGGVAHELRNPLNVVKTSIYYLLNARSPTPEKTLEHHQRIERQVNACDRTISAISDFAKVGTPETKQIKLNQLVENALASEPIPDACEVDFQRGADVSIEGDERQLEIVLGNLIRNGVEAMPQGGTLSIVVDLDQQRPMVRISDQGEGISKDVMQRISEPLFSTKARGIGLGLAMVKSILDRHQAELIVSSQQGAGSTFEVVFPVEL